MVEIATTTAIGLVVNTILVDLLARLVGRLGTLHIETRLVGAFILLAGVYLLLAGGAFSAMMIATSAIGALFLLSRYRKAAARVRERRNTAM